MGWWGAHLIQPKEWRYPGLGTWEGAHLIRPREWRYVSTRDCLHWTSNTKNFLINEVTCLHSVSRGMEWRKIKSTLFILSIKEYCDVRREGNHSDLVEPTQQTFFFVLIDDLFYFLTNASMGRGLDAWHFLIVLTFFFKNLWRTLVLFVTLLVVLCIELELKNFTLVYSTDSSIGFKILGSESFTRWLVMGTSTWELGKVTKFSPHCLWVHKVQNSFYQLVGFECLHHLWLSTLLKLHSLLRKMMIRRSLPPSKILGQKAKSNHKGDSNEPPIILWI